MPAIFRADSGSERKCMLGTWRLLPCRMFYAALRFIRCRKKPAIFIFLSAARSSTPLPGVKLRRGSDGMEQDGNREEGGGGGAPFFNTFTSPGRGLHPAPRRR